MKVQYTVVAAPYKKATISEDAHRIIQNTQIPFFAVVVDGHRSGAVSKSVVAQYSFFIAHVLGDEYSRLSDPKKYAQIFDTIHERLEREFPKIGAGAVVSCVSIHDDKLYLAQTGDCRLYVSSSNDKFGSGSICLSNDHIGENLAESARIHPYVMSGDFALKSDEDPRYTELRLWRKQGDGWAYGSLQPTRAFGDHEFRPAITHKPETRVFDLSDHKDQIFALCSDGGNAIVREAFAARRVEDEKKNSLEFMTQVAERAQPRLNDDDVTIVFFKVSKED